MAPISRSITSIPLTICFLLKYPAPQSTSDSFTAQSPSATARPKLLKKFPIAPKKAAALFSFFSGTIVMSAIISLSTYYPAWRSLFRRPFQITSRERKSPHPDLGVGFFTPSGGYII